MEVFLKIKKLCWASCSLLTNPKKGFRRIGKWKNGKMEKWKNYSFLS
jgi:hypothetical protein